MGQTVFEGEPPFQLMLTQQPLVCGDSGAVIVTLFASVAGKGPADVPVKLGLSTSEASQLIADIQRAIVEARKRHR
jgi:hypothetical protein